jgi:hypothetical protein
MEEATTRQRWLLAAGLALALVPSRLADLSPAFGPREARAPAAVEADPTRLALAAPDLVGSALRLEVGPRFEHREAPPEPSPGAPVVEPWTPAPLVAARAVAEPRVWWLLALSLASAASASRGTRRFPRWHRPR